MDQPDRELSVFGTARLLPGPERGAYLDQACAGDAELRLRVEELIRAGEKAGDFLANPATSIRGLATVHTSVLPVEKPGDRIGRYVLRQSIGEGGCGVVYLADQELPLRRQVALKVIKLGMDTKNVIARFEAERQALALMDHPNIAKVLDAGATDAGRPYFVMELVRGIKITDYCDQHHLSTRERLDLFMQVCRAVQHAHQKGIIHRDLKPSNILVAEEDGVPVPKVIDFGIAKATQGKLANLTVFTAFEQFLGTPAYMSPEQAQPGAVDIDTRSDIYSLGVLLYELLTGQTPFDAKKLLEAGLDEVCRTIRHKEPARPSTRLGTIPKADLTTIAKCRQVEPPKLIHLVQGDLDWIVMKSLEKDRARRYETANGLATDIQRHIRNEPVVARPPGQLYAIQKMVRRHKLVFAAGTIVVLALILALGASIVALVFIKRAKDETIKSLVLVKKARDDATESLWNSYLVEARATRLSDQTGQRLTSLETLVKAASIHPAPAVRDELIAALAMSDLRIAKQKVITGHIHNENANFDLSLQYYAFTAPDGSIIIRTATNDGVVTVLPAPAPGSLLEGIGAFSVDAKYLSARYGRTNEGDSYWVWDWKHHQVVAKALQNPDDPHAAYFNFAGDFSPDGRFFASSRWDGSISIYELAAGQETKRFPGSRTFNRLTLNPGDTRLACSSSEHPEVEIRDIASGEILRTLACPAGVSAVGWSADGRRLATACADFCIYVWDVETGARLAVLKGHDAYIMCVAFSHAGTLLASASYDGVVRLWSPENGRQVARYAGSSWQLHFSPDDHYLTGWQDHACYGWLEVVASHECRQLCLPRDGGFQSLPQFSPDGNVLAVGTANRVHFWDTGSGGEIGCLAQPDFDALVFPPDGRSIITVDRVSGINQRSLEKKEGLVSVAYRLGRPRPIFASEVLQNAALSRDGRRLAVTQQLKGKAWVLDLQNPSNRVVLSPHTMVNRIAISPDGQWVATASFYSSFVKLWNAQTGDLVRSFSQPPRSGVTFSPDGRWLATTARENRLWKVGSWEPAGSAVPGFEGPQENFTIFSPGGYMMARTEGHRIQLLEAATQKTLAMLEAPGSGTVTKCQFSPDGSQLAAVQADQQVQLWDLRLVREELAPLHLDWDSPPYALAPKTPARPVTLEIDSDKNSPAP